VPAGYEQHDRRQGEPGIFQQRRIEVTLEVVDRDEGYVEGHRE